MWKIVFQAIPVIAWCVSVLVVVMPLKLKRRAAIIVAFVLAAAFGKFAFFAVVGGDGFNPNLPQIVVWFCGWAYATAMMLTVFAFAAVLADGAMRICRHPVRPCVKRVRIVLLAAFAALVSLWGMYEGVCVPSVKRVEIRCKDLPPAFDGYRIVHLSDLHCSTAARRGRFEKIVGRVNALDADLVAITGDFVDGRVSERSDDLAPLAGLRAKDGVVACTGNHEAYWGWNEWRTQFHEWGIVFPEETGARAICRGDDMIVVGGLADPVFMRWSVGAHKNADAAFAGAPSGTFRILLHHRPCAAAIKSEAADVRLQLSGHTHGGAMPGISRLVARANEGRTRGLYEFASGRFLYLSPGTGQWAGFPLRLFNPAEITEIILHSGGDSGKPSEPSS